VLESLVVSTWIQLGRDGKNGLMFWLIKNKGRFRSQFVRLLYCGVLGGGCFGRMRLMIGGCVV
jgi:hypothetical protein